MGKKIQLKSGEEVTSEGSWTYAPELCLRFQQKGRQLKDFKEHMEIMLLWRDMSVDYKQIREIISKQKN